MSLPLITAKWADYSTRWPSSGSMLSLVDKNNQCVFWLPNWSQFSTLLSFLLGDWSTVQWRLVMQHWSRIFHMISISSVSSLIVLQTDQLIAISTLFLMMSCAKALNLKQCDCTRTHFAVRLYDLFAVNFVWPTFQQMLIKFTVPDTCNGKMMDFCGLLPRERSHNAQHNF